MDVQKSAERAELLASIVERMKAEILADAGVAKSSSGEIMPLFPESFSQLHDYVDANEYGGLCDDNFGHELLLDADGELDFGALNYLQNTIHDWLVTRKAEAEAGSLPRRAYVAMVPVEITVESDGMVTAQADLVDLHDFRPDPAERGESQEWLADADRLVVARWAETHMLLNDGHA